MGAYGPAEKAATTDIIYEGAAAVRILQWQIQAYGQPQRRIAYLASPRDRGRGFLLGFLATLTLLLGGLGGAVADLIARL